jgi:hypothetical protein
MGHMSNVSHWTIQAFMGFVLIVFAFLSWMGTTTLPLDRSPKQEKIVDFPSPQAIPLPALSETESRSPPAMSTDFSFLSVSIPEGYSQALEVRVPFLPATKEEFLSLRESMSKSPEGGAALFILALNIYAKDPGFGETCLTMMLANDSATVQTADPGAWKGYKPSEKSLYYLSHVSSSPRIARSYVYGTSLADDYRLPSLPWSIFLSRNKYSAKDTGEITVHAFSTGADSRRPIGMMKNDQGIWKVSNFSSLVVSVKKPLPPDPL